VSPLTGLINTYFRNLKVLRGLWLCIPTELLISFDCDSRMRMVVESKYDYWYCAILNFLLAKAKNTFL